VAHAAPAVRALTTGTVVLGGTGFIGSHLAERLARNAEVTVVSTKGSWPWREFPPGIRFVSLDLAAPDGQRALDGVLAQATRVINLIGALARASTPSHRYTRLHVDAVHRIMTALAASRVRRSRLIHVSTTGVLGPTGTTPRDEEAPPRPGNLYERTKLEGETIALAGRRPAREVVIVRPGLVYGPRDLHLLAWFRAIAGGTYRPISKGRATWQPIFVDDVARGIERALEIPAADGQTFHLAGVERVTVAELGARIARALDKPPPRASVPYPLAMAAGALFEAAYGTWKSDPPLTRARVRTMTEDRVYAIDRAARLLAFHPAIRLDEGVPRAVAWYRSQGLL